MVAQVVGNVLDAGAIERQLLEIGAAPQVGQTRLVLDFRQTPEKTDEKMWSILYEYSDQVKSGIWGHTPDQRVAASVILRPCDGSPSAYVWQLPRQTPGP